MSDGLNPWQRLYRVLWRFMGPAQTGLPPYATPQEREEYRRRNQPRPPAVSEPPPGYRFLVYTDPNGVPRRALIPIDPTAPREVPAATNAATTTDAGTTSVAPRATDAPTPADAATATTTPAATTAPVAPDGGGGTAR